MTQEYRIRLQTDHIEEMIAYMGNKDPKYIPTLIENAGAYQEYMFYVTSLNESKYAVPQNMFIPPQPLNDEDATRVADINAVLDIFKKQAIVEFIIGVRNISSNTDWNAYLAELDRLGSPEIVSIRQKYVKQ